MSYEKQEPYVINRGKLGWAVHWPCGFESAMPSREIAMRSAASGEMYNTLLASRAAFSVLNYEGPINNEIAHAILRARGEA